MEKDNITYELCPHCEAEVELPNTLGVYKCPECGKYIPNCSMCLALSDDMENCCVNCPLEYLAKKMNEDGETESEKDIMAIGDMFSEREIDDMFNFLYKNAYQESRKSYGQHPYRTIFCDEKDLVTYKNCLISEARLIISEARLNTETHNVVLASETTLNSIDFKYLPFDIYQKLKDIVVRVDNEWVLNGTATVNITRVKGRGRTFGEAKAYASEIIDSEFTLYGQTESEIADIHLEI